MELPARESVSAVKAPGSVLLIAAYDSQLKWCAGLRSELDRRGVPWRVVVPKSRSALSAQQIADAGFSSVERASWAQLIAQAAQSEVVVSALAGPQTRVLVRELCRQVDTGGPVLVSGWVGVIFDNRTAGYLDRAGCDVVAVNSGNDLQYFRDVAERLEIAEDNLVLSGLPFLSDSRAERATGPINTVLFADQPTVPRTAETRLLVYRKLLDYARRHPDRTVLLKPRHRRGEDTIHTMRHHPEDLLARDELPPNFGITYEPITQLLESTDLLLTISSTVALEALDRGVRVALITDAGVHEQLGNHVLIESGLMRSFAQVELDDIGIGEPAWLDSWFGQRSGTSGAVIVDRVEQLLASGERPGREAALSQWFAIEPPRPFRPDESPAWMSRAWYRRIADRGAVLGTASYLGVVLTPPVVSHAARRAIKALRPNAKVY